MRALVFVTKPDCPLCDEGLASVRRAGRIFRSEVDVVDVRSDPAFEVHRSRLPVVIAGDRVILEGRWSSWDALRALAAARASALVRRRI